MVTPGDRFYILRKQLKFTQEEIGSKVGVSRQTVILWESGRLPISKKTAHHICVIFGLKTNYFYPDEKIEVILPITESIEEEVVACTEDLQAKAEEPIIESVKEEVKAVPEIKEKSKKNKKLLIIIISSLLLGIAAAIFKKAITPPYDPNAIETIVVEIYNFSLESISGIVSFVAIAVGLITLTVFITRKIKIKIKNKQ